MATAMEKDETSVEMEALRFTYADDLTVLSDYPLSIKIAISPHTGFRKLFHVPLHLMRYRHLYMEDSELLCACRW
jgi:hypothetical protein